MFKEIKSIFTPKGELAGIPFLVNYVILRLFATIINYIGLYLYFNDLMNIPAIKLLNLILLILTFGIVVVIIFNYKRRLLQITNNLVISIILAILLSVIFDVILFLIYFKPILMILELIIIPLILAVLPPKNCDKKDYWTTFLNRTKKVLKHPLTIFVIIMIIADIGLIKYSIIKNNKISKITPSEQMENLVINPLTSYSGKTKDEILKTRKEFVKTSIFNNENYEPNNKVFGNIADKKPWWGIDYILCTDKNIPVNSRDNGNSEESRYLNNPNLLVGVTMSKNYIKNEELKDFCEDKSLLFIPKSISYDKSNKLIIITYKSSKYFTAKINRHFIEFLLVGLNARDFGYEWIYITKSNNLRFLPYSLDKTMVNDKPQKFKDFIHLGNACQVDGGCNNSSPYQPEMAFSFKNIPADMTLSLWKNKPIYKNQPADIYVKMIFE